MISSRKTSSRGRGPIRGVSAASADGSRSDDAAFSVCTRTRVDTGSWFCKRRVWAYVLDGRLVLMARGRRPLIENIPFDQLRDSLYNHVMGEVVLGPAEGVDVTRLRMSPLEAKRLLECIGLTD
jgi:hypothetical protein